VKPKLAPGRAVRRKSRCQRLGFSAKFGFCISSLLAAAACKSGGKAEPAPTSGTAADPGGAAPVGGAARATAGSIIAIDGSSTVFPITEAVAEEFRGTSSAKVTIGVSGTGGGFKKFCKGETAVSGASRPIKPSEVELCKAENVEYIELPVAYDGISVVVNPANDWAEHMTVSELKALWRPEAQGKVQRWSQVRMGWPDEEIHLFGAGVDSGTYDYFTSAIVGTEHASRGDFTSSEDDNVLVQGVATDRLALGFFGFAYYEQNQSRLKVVPIDDERDDNGKGPIRVSPASVIDGSYSPLSRPVFIYVSKVAANRPEVVAFIDYYLAKAPELVPEVGYIPLPERGYGLVSKRFENRVSGSIFGGTGSRINVSVESLLAGE
jgi:phosphate transport system substrate-binding protein